MNDTEQQLKNWWRETNGTGTAACPKCRVQSDDDFYVCSWHQARLADLADLLQPTNPVDGEIDAILKRYSFAVQELHAGVKPFDDGVEAGRYRSEAKAAISNHLQAAVRETESKVIATIYSIANDLANKDPEATGSVSLAPYLANAIAIYQEYLKGDKYERVDWKSLNLPTLQQPEKGAER